MIYEDHKTTAKALDLKHRERRKETIGIWGKEIERWKYSILDD